MLKTIKNKIAAYKDEQRRAKNLRDRAVLSSRAPINEYSARNKPAKRLNRVCLVLYCLLLVVVVGAMTASIVIDWSLQ